MDDVHRVTNQRIYNEGHGLWPLPHAPASINDDRLTRDHVAVL